MRLHSALALLVSAPFVIGCGGDAAHAPNAADDTAFVDGESAIEDGKEDTGYQTSLDGQEVEVDLEGDVEASGWGAERAPLSLGQFALTHLRQHSDVYLQSLAEDYTHGPEKIEWQVNGAWTTLAASPSLDRKKLTHFRMKGISAVVLHPGRDLVVGKKWAPPVPKKPDSLFADVGDKCGEKEGSIDVEQGVYWYVWKPEKAGCNAKTAPMSVTVSKVLGKGGTTYPEYDRLTADKKIDVLVMFGQVDHGELANSDYSFSLIRSFESSLRTAGFKKGTAPIGLRYTRTKGGLAETVDIYGPREFAGLDDYAHIDNFDKGVNSHEVIVWNGHSMLGASDFWARPSIYAEPTRYQVFLYNGCLGYEYYVNPILEGKQGFDNVDLVSNVIETPFAIMVQETSSVVSMIMAGAEKGGTTSWQSILGRMNDLAGSDSLYGASGIRTNTFKPRR